LVYGVLPRAQGIRERLGTRARRRLGCKFHRKRHGARFDEFLDRALSDPVYVGDLVPFHVKRSIEVRDRDLTFCITGLFLIPAVPSNFIEPDRFDRSFRILFVTKESSVVDAFVFRSNVHVRSNNGPRKQRDKHLVVHRPKHPVHKRESDDLRLKVGLRNDCLRNIGIYTAIQHHAIPFKWENLLLRMPFSR